MKGFIAGGHRRGSSQGFSEGVHRRGSSQGFSEGFYLNVLIISFHIHVLQEIVYNTYAEMSNIMRSE